MKEFTLTTDNFDDCVDAATGQPIPREGNVVLPERVIFQGEEYLLTNIGNRAFCGCSMLTSIYIPKGVVKIRYGAFAYSGLNFIDIPDSVTNIGHDAFEGCKDSLLISFMGTDILKRTYDMVKDQSDGLSGIKCLTIAKKAVDILGKDIYSPVLVSKSCNAEHGGKLEQTAAQIKKISTQSGFTILKTVWM